MPPKMSNKRKASNDSYVTESLTSYKQFKENSRFETPTNKSLLNSFTRKKIKGDGNCLFRAILYSLFQSDKEHADLRNDVCDYMLKNSRHFKHYIDEETEGSFENYVNRMRDSRRWGDQPEIVAASKLLRFNFTIYQSNSLNIRFHHFYSHDFKTIYLEFANDNHYDVLLPKLPKITIKLNKQEKHSSADTSIPKKRIIQKNNTSSTSDQKKKQDIQKSRITTMKEEKSFPIEIQAFNSKSLNQESKRLYMNSKGNSNAYNEAYMYLKYNKIPERIKSTDSQNLWKKEIKKKYFLSKIPQSKMSKSLLVFLSKKKM